MITNTGLQAIVTKFHGPTNSRGSRVSAKCRAARVTVAWDYSLYSADNHRRAAEALCDKLGWSSAMVGGELPDGTGCCFVFTSR